MSRQKNRAYLEALRFVENFGALLTFPMNNKKEPRSLWQCFYPRTPLVWEWDDDGDTKVFQMWALREELSRSSKVVYGKFYKGRATFFSRNHFASLLAVAKPWERREKYKYGPEADILNALEDNSPLSTKELKRTALLQGKRMESTYQKAMKNLWKDLLIVGFGEKDEGAFPSLQMGATQILFEDLWKEAKRLDPPKGELDPISREIIKQITTSG
jgi:hypothetical protein